MTKSKTLGFLIVLATAMILTLLSPARAMGGEKKSKIQDLLETRIMLTNYSGSGHMDYTENGKKMNLDMKLGSTVSWAFDAYYKTGRRKNNRLHFSFFAIGNQPLTATPNGEISRSSSEDFRFTGSLAGKFNMSFMELGYERAFFFKPDDYRIGAYIGVLYGNLSVDGLNANARNVSGSVGGADLTNGSFDLRNLGKAWYRGPLPNAYLFAEKYLGSNKAFLGSFKIIGIPEVGSDEGKVSSLNYEVGLAYCKNSWEFGLNYLYKDLKVKYNDTKNGKSANMNFNYSGLGLSLKYKF